MHLYSTVVVAATVGLSFICLHVQFSYNRYSPRLLSSNKLEPGTVVVDEEEDAQRLAWARSRVMGAGQPVETVLSAEEKVMQQEAQRAMTKWVLPLQT